MSNIVVANESQDVNDVLASIRKLVSEEAQARSQEALKLTPALEVEDTLMLTPDQRVVNEAPQKKLVLDAPVTAPKEALTSVDQAAPFQDEVALRSLVSEMIREELQGELGNRITRNVRKLVRKEIETAMKSYKD